MKSYLRSPQEEAWHSNPKRCYVAVSYCYNFLAVKGHLVASKDDWSPQASVWDRSGEKLKFKAGDMQEVSSEE